jgi:glycosyltransferase involved in cell wall biosynthesis
MDQSVGRGRRLGYLSAAPRVSTRPEAEAGGPRSHVLGTIEGFESLGWEVRRFIVGDRVPRKWTDTGSRQAISSSVTRALAADVARLVLGVKNAKLAWREIGQVDWVYERLSVLQSLGWAFQRHGVPWILETNALLFHEAKVERKSIALGWLARFLEMRAYQRCDLLVCVSEALKEMVVSASGISAKKALVLPNGVNTCFFDPKRYQPRRVFDGFTIGFVGNLAKWQGLGVLLEAMSELREEKVDLSLVVVGDGSTRAEWETQAQSLDLASNVRFVGRIPRDEVPHYTAGFDIGYAGQVLPAIGQMYLSPLKLFEYMAMAKPVIASDFEDARRVTRNGEIGFLFRGGDKEDLKRKLLRAYHCADQLPEIGHNAREEVVAHHSWTARVQTLIDYFQQRFEA